MKKDYENSKLMHRVIALLDRKAIDFLDRIGKDIQFSTGHKFSRTQIIRDAIDFLMTLHIDPKGITDDKKFMDKIFKAVIEKYKSITPTTKEILLKEKISSHRAKEEDKTNEGEA